MSSTNTNVFTTTFVSKTSAAPVRRSDVKNLEAQKASIAKSSKSSMDSWVQDEQTKTLLPAQEMAWCGKALLAEAMRYQFRHGSKKLTKTLLEKAPLMSCHQRRFDEDFAFDLEEKQRSEIIDAALDHMKAVNPTITEEELVEERRALDCRISVPEIDPSSVTAPMAPAIAQAMWNDFDVVLGTTSTATTKKDDVPMPTTTPAPAKGQTMMSLQETRSKYAAAVNHFSQMMLWRLSSPKKKRSSRSSN